MDNKEHEKKLSIKYKVIPITTIIFCMGFSLSFYLIPNDSPFILLILRIAIWAVFLIPYLFNHIVVDFIYNLYQK